jgi:hypothetical protein
MTVKGSVLNLKITRFDSRPDIPIDVSMAFLSHSNRIPGQHFKYHNPFVSHYSNSLLITILPLLIWRCIHSVILKSLLRKDLWRKIGHILDLYLLGGRLCEAQPCNVCVKNVRGRPHLSSPYLSDPCVTSGKPRQRRRQTDRQTGMSWLQAFI